MGKIKKILITGAAGFLGSHLSEKLSNMGHEIIAVDNLIGGYKDNIPKNITFYEYDCCDLDKMSSIMKDVDIVYHCAATAHEGLSVFSPVTITKNVYLASVSVFTAAIKHKVKRIIFCSSMARYGDQKPPFTEEMNPAPVDPVQAKVMQFLPVIFTIFFAFFPSGLVLYWVVNNVLSIAQQWRITSQMEKAK